jgi:hypothetical protein
MKTNYHKLPTYWCDNENAREQHREMSYNGIKQTEGGM